MKFKNLRLKLKVFKLKRFLGGGGRKRESENGKKKPSWMVPVSHGYHVVEEKDRSVVRTGESNELDSQVDSVVVQREQIGEHELWFFGLFHPVIGDGVTKYIQSHLFHSKHPTEISRTSKEAIKKAYTSTRAKIRRTKKPEEMRRVGSTSAIVIDSENLVIANMGDYRAVVCKEGEAYQITTRHQLATKRHWSRKFIPVGAMWIPKVHIIASESGTAVATKSSEVIVGSERIDTDTEFVILASTGIWEVMKHQEAVNLIRQIEDPKEAAKCLAKEALARMSTRNISCLVIRFD